MSQRQHPEHSLQVSILDYLDIKGRRELRWTAIENGGLRHPLVAARIKAAGVKPGTPDIVILMDNGQTGWIECKSKRGQLRPEQKGFAASAVRLGHRWAMVKSLDVAIGILKEWGVLR